MKKRKAAKKPHIKHEKFRDRNISSLESHPREGKTLKNPFSVIRPQMTPRSWVNECIPNILWACVLAAALDRPHYLRLFRTVAINIRANIPRHSDLFISHNFLSKFSEAEFDIAFCDVLADPEATDALRALLLVDCLPDRALWSSRLAPPDDSHWQTLGHAVGGCFDHQSQSATDIRWIKLMFFIITGRMMFPSEMAVFLENLRLYPDRGDMRSVRPMIRAAEIGLRTVEFGEEILGDKKTTIELPPPHQEAFWSEMQGKTQCLPNGEMQSPERADPAVTRALLDVSEGLAEHFHSTTQHTGLDARHDACFGLLFYALNLVTDISVSYSHTGSIGRSTLRTIVECFITLSYLVKKDDPALWLKYRDHGNGQTKLSLLKNLSAESVPRFIDLELLESLANEDKWLEFHDINFGAWAEKNLRVMATEAGIKDVYDAYYDLCSGYTHGQWSAVRDASFITCFNPLHRFHRIPRPVNFGMKSIIHDGLVLLNRMTDEVVKLYPGFTSRLEVNTETKPPDENDGKTKGAETG
ncbi:MAG: DUF5677 domain-containing protein [Pseudolabrys sp.]